MRLPRLRNGIIPSLSALATLDVRCSVALTRVTASPSFTHARLRCHSPCCAYGARKRKRGQPGTESLAGQLLIAAPAICDPRFAHSVILVIRHDKAGAFGIVINRPVGERSITSLLEATGDSDPAATGNVQVFAGGPVQPELGFVVHSAEYHREETVDVDGRVAMTSSRQILRDMGHNQGPEKSLCAFGYAGWGPAQLEGEVARHDWFIT